MNVPYPTSGQTAGVFMSAGLMATMAGGLYVLFKRNDWL
jgi:LPXTG-motif cell wall-anchored protein